MPVTNYHSVEGRLLGETTSGFRTDYLTDALGSVVATADQTPSVGNTYRHKPYGEPLAKTGSQPDPRFLWTGASGSRTTSMAWAEQYNVARHYGTRQAAWTAIDPTWPRQPAYGYTGGNPSTRIDPSGLAPIYVQLCAFIGGWRALPAPWYPFSDTYVPDIGLNTNARDFFSDPLECKVFIEISIDSCSIGSSEPAVKVITGTSKIMQLSSLNVFHEGTPPWTSFVYSSDAQRCRSHVVFQVRAGASLPWVGGPQLPPIIMVPFVFFSAGPDSVKVDVAVLRTEFPDFEYRIGGPGTFYRYKRPSYYYGPEVGLIMPMTDDDIAHVAFPAPTSRC